VSFNEVINLLNGLTVRAVSSGAAIGACNWVLATETAKIVYISASSTAGQVNRPLSFFF
jgi:hypothetical protein